MKFGELLMGGGVAPSEVLDRMDDIAALVEASEKLWPAYRVYVSAGSTSAAFQRHVFPVIREVRAILTRVAPTRYAVGYRDAPGSYGMFYGPVPTYEECAEVSPSDDSRQAFIIKFDPSEGDHPVARWDARRSKWRSC